MMMEDDWVTIIHPLIQEELEVGVTSILCSKDRQNRK